MYKHLITTFLLMAACSVPPAVAQEIVLDTDSQSVNAHGGCILRHDNTWYWYGEARPRRGFTSLGVSLYTAEIPAPPVVNHGDARMLDGPGMVQIMTFLQDKHWVNRGLVLSVVDSAGSPIERGCIIERPKVIYNRRTQQYVMLDRKSVV